MNQQTCPRCGATLLPGHDPARPCPRCLMKLGFGSDVAGGPAPEPAPSPEELAPDFPQLEILELVGQGGMGAVYKARQKDLGRVVALKILSFDADEDPAFAERFTREAKALASLSHPSILTIHDFGRAGRHWYITTEFVDGENLRQLIRSGRIDPRRALSMVAQISEALQYAHDAGVVHRDIKPENILVDRQGKVKIADFGLAKMLRRQPTDFTLTGTQQAMGTVHYMAPEQIERPLDVDHRADIFSLGVVFYELLTGELPLGSFPPPSSKVEVDVRVDDVVLKSLQKAPERRYQHASDVKHDVDSISSGEAAAASGRPHPPRERGRGPQSPMAWALTGCMAFLLLFGCGGAALMALLVGPATPVDPATGAPVPSSHGHGLALIAAGLGAAVVIGLIVWAVRAFHSRQRAA